MEGSLSAFRNACDTLHLKNGSLSSALVSAQAQLELVSREQQDVTSQLFIWKTRYACSIDARQHAASTWFSYRLQSDALRTASFVSLLKILGLLWRMATGLRSALRNEKAALAIALNAQQGLVRDITALRTELHDKGASAKATIDSLTDERDDFKKACEQARDTHAELEAAYDRLMETHTALDRDFQASSSELVETSQERDSLQLESQRLQSQLSNTQRELACTTSLLTKLQEDHSKLSRSNDDLSARCLFLQAQGDALATQHSDLGRDLDTLKTEHKTLHSAHDNLTQNLKEEKATRTTLESSLSAAQKHLEEHETVHRLMDSTLQTLRKERHRLNHLDHDAWTRAIDSAHQDALSPSIAASEIVVGAQEDARMVLALLGYTKGLRRRLGELEHRRDTLWLPAFNLMQNIGGQINSVTLDNLPLTPSPSMALPKLTITIPKATPAPLTPGTPTLSRSALPTPVSAVFPSTPDVIVFPLPPTHVQVGPRDICASSASPGWSSTCSEPQLNDVFSTSVRIFAGGPLLHLLTVVFSAQVHVSSKPAPVRAENSTEASPSP
ncbi:hypothetical protein PENSPDRAFT_57335 [Peniophora sp. CONT]|nr:hypothetical protein PENSPDRAFT_57335 [Peniophora sp. CONT]